jgi:hypothetical protein
MKTIAIILAAVVSASPASAAECFPLYPENEAGALLQCTDGTMIETFRTGPHVSSTTVTPPPPERSPLWEPKAGCDWNGRCN